MELNKDNVKMMLAGVVLGVFWFVVIRALFFYPQPVHYHADFAVIINGERQAYDSPIYYEDTLACTQNDNGNSRGRAHLHQPENDIVHIHDNAVTWGNFFENIGWALGNNFIKTDTELLADSDGGELTFILNGNSTRQLADKVIGSEDRLLIAYGQYTDEQLNTYFKEISTDAAEFNTKPDPASCSGDAEPSLWQRLRYGLLG